MRAEAVRRAVAHALASAPGLGAFAVAVGQLGLHGAVRLCATRRPSRALKRAWDELGYRIEQLPSAEDARLLLVGIEVNRALYVARTAKPDTPLAVVVKELGHKQLDVNRGLKLVRGYGANPNPTYEEAGPI